MRFGEKPHEIRRGKKTDENVLLSAKMSMFPFVQSAPLKQSFSVNTKTDGVSYVAVYPKNLNLKSHYNVSGKQ